MNIMFLRRCQILDKYCSNIAITESLIHHFTKSNKNVNHGLQQYYLTVVFLYINIEGAFMNMANMSK